MASLGDKLADAGWRQGSIVCSEDLANFLSGQPATWDRKNAPIAVVVSQSCDLTYSNLDAEPFAEILLFEATAVANDPGKRGEFTHGKHPRRICLPVQTDIEGVQWIESAPSRRFAIPRDRLAGRAPDPNRYVLNADLRALLNWLAQRYLRSAFPDQFNALLNPTREKQKKLHKRISGHVSELAVRLNPHRELESHEQYSVDLLALVPQAFASSLEVADSSVQALADLMRECGMDINARTLTEDRVSYAMMREFQRFPLEHVSLREDPPDPLPADQPR